MLLSILFGCYSANGLKVQNTAPTANIYSHEDGQELEEGSTEVFIANIVDLNDSLESLTIEWLYGGQPVCTEAYIDRNDDTFCELTLLPQVTSIQVIVRDSANSVGDDILNFTLASNMPPEAPVIVLSPSEPSTIDDIVASASANDPDGDVLEFSYSWVLQEEPDTVRSSTNVLSSDETTKGQVWIVTAEGFDGRETGPSSSTSVTIVNAPPVIDQVVISPNTNVFNDGTLTCFSTASDPDQAEDLSHITYEWFSNGISLSQTEEVVLNPMSVEPNDAVICQATAFDVDGDSSMLQQSILVENREFVINDAYLTPDFPVVDDVLEVYVDATDPDLQTLNVGYSWFVNSATVSTSGSTLSGMFVKGDVVDVEINIDDGDHTSMLSYSTTIVNSAPSQPGVVGLPNAPMAGQDDLLCDLDVGSFDADGDAISYAITWTKNGSTYSGPTSTTHLNDDTIPASQTSLNDVWACQIGASDGVDVVLSSVVGFTTINDYCEYYVSQTCTTSSTTWQYGRNSYCGVNPTCVWCCNQDYIDPDCEGWCSTANPGEAPCPSWHGEYYNACDYPTTTTTEYECGYNTTGLCN